MAYQTVFKRYKLKYILTEEQKLKVLEALVPHMVLDESDRSTIRNIYCDIDNYHLIRHSIEKPTISLITMIHCIQRFFFTMKEDHIIPGRNPFDL